MYFVYILLCRDDSLYTGITNNLDKRLTAHRHGTASRYTRSRGVKRFVYIEPQRTKGAALSREAAIKRLSRAEKRGLIRAVGDSRKMR
jgi:putative endonuclease